MIGRKGSVGYAGKNVRPILGRPLCLYPLLAARHARGVDRLFVSTDSAAVRSVGEGVGAEWIERPARLATMRALGEDAFAHGYREIRRRLGETPEMIVLLFANAPTILSSSIEAGIEVLRARPDIDSAVTASAYNMWAPARARRIGDGGLLAPFVPAALEGATCDRNAQGDVFFHDCGASVVRPRCLERLSDGLPPQRWMGRRIHPIVQEGGLDVDYEWQMPLVEGWLRRHGFTERRTPYGAASKRRAPRATGLRRRRVRPRPRHRA